MIDARSKVTVRVKVDEVSIPLDSGNAAVTYARDTVLEVDAVTAMQLFTDGKVSLEEMRPAGAPPHVEAR